MNEPTMLDRGLQRFILTTLSTAYPEGLFELPQPDAAPASERAVLVNLQYLAEHGLVRSGYRRRGTLSANEFIAVDEHVITAQGLDFLADDGGLTAVLGVVTVSISTATMRALVDARLHSSAIPEADKARISKTLRALGTEALTEATKRLVNEGLDRWPQALEWLGTLRG